MDEKNRNKWDFDILELTNSQNILKIKYKSTNGENYSQLIKLNYGTFDSKFYIHEQI